MRKLKIEQRGGSGQLMPPQIRLKGKWLEAAGFPAGGSVNLSVTMPGVMVLSAVKGATGCL